MSERNFITSSLLLCILNSVLLLIFDCVHCRCPCRSPIFTRMQPQQVRISNCVVERPFTGDPLTVVAITTGRFYNGRLKTNYVIVPFFLGLNRIEENLGQYNTDFALSENKILGDPR